MFVKRCKYCKKEFLSRNERKIYCKDSCSTLFYRNRNEGAKQKHRDRNKFYQYKRRYARKYGQHIATPRELADLRKKFPTCVICRNQSNLTIDHIISLRHGGTTHITNLIIMCGKCNSSKQHKDITEWLNLKNISVPKCILNKIEQQKQLKISPFGERDETILGIVVKCCVCETQFQRPVGLKGIYCSKKCKQKRKYSKLVLKENITQFIGTDRVCKGCVTVFEPASWNQLYCNKMCRLNNYFPPIIKCKVCGNKREKYGRGMCRSCWKKGYLLKKNPIKQKKCKKCSKTFETRFSFKIFCSNECKIRYHSENQKPK